MDAMASGDVAKLVALAQIGLPRSACFIVFGLQIGLPVSRPFEADIFVTAISHPSPRITCRARWSPVR